MNEKAIFAGGCFWGMEYHFGQLHGVVSTRVGYAGGFVENPTYEQVCSDVTGHAEAVEVIYDARIVSYMLLLEFFFSIHDPTTPNRQGPDIGTQYRSVIFYSNDNQRKMAWEYLEKFKETSRRQVVTEIKPAGSFYAAEEFHQQYYSRQGKMSCGY